MRLLIETQDREQHELWPHLACPCNLVTEDSSYMFRLQVDSGQDLAGLHLYLGDVAHGAGRLERTGEMSWAWTARDYAGEITVGVERAGQKPLIDTVEIVVDPNRSKLTRDEFALMVADITAEASIAYSLSPATQHVAPRPGKESFGLSQLEYIRRQIGPLTRTVEAIARRPRRELVEEIRKEYLGSARGTDDRSVTWMLKQPAELIQIPETSPAPAGARRLASRLSGHLPERVLVGKRRITYDVYENRLLKRFLQRLSRALRETEARLGHTSTDKSYQIDDDIKRLAKRRLADVKRYRRSVHDLLDFGFLSEVSPLRHLQPVTQALRRDPHYAQFYRIYRQFDRAMSPFDGGPYSLSLDKTWQLYEYWCFFQTIRALRQLFGDDLDFDAKAMLRPGSDRISLALPEATIRINSQVTVRFQRTYSYYGWSSRAQGSHVGTYSHELRPDISIEVADGCGNIDRIILLDPKYRVSASSLNQAMDDLHRYKDAIVAPDRRRLVRTALALCPSDQGAKQLYFDPEFRLVHGLGALKLKPGKPDTTDSLASALRLLLSEREHA